ncbi:MAG: pyruvate kinase [Pseudomonadota bacterium]
MSSRNAKIIATLGPATSTRADILALARAGVNVFRVNFSHGSHDDHRERVEAIRTVETEVGHPLGVLMDLQGPKLRVGVFRDGPIDLAEGAHFALDLDPAPGDASRVNLPHPEIFAALNPGDRLLLDDGKVKLQVVSCGADHAETRVVVGGKLSERKGVNVPDAALNISPVTDKDRRDLEFGLSLGVDWVAFSFVQRPSDLEEARALVGDRAKIMAKLEKPQAIESLEEIVDLSDAVMVARGDLGVELPPEKVPPVQKRIVRYSRLTGKPVVIATQMLESMIESATPTRAETNDIGNAIYDGVDAVMLSAETAAGKYPVEAVQVMARIISEVEQDPHYQELVDRAQPIRQRRAADAIAAALSRVAEVMPVATTVCYSDSGATALRCARERPHSPILGLTCYPVTARMMTVVWGVRPVLCATIDSVDSMVSVACSAARDEGYADVGDAIVITAGMPFGEPGRTNLLRIARVP